MPEPTENRGQVWCRQTWDLGGSWERRGAARTPELGCEDSGARLWEELCRPLCPVGENHISAGKDMTQTLNTAGVRMVSNQI